MKFSEPCAGAGQLGSTVADTATSALPRPVRVLHVINGEFFAGAERMQDTLASCLPDRGYEVGFACVKAGRFDQTRRARHAPVFGTAMRNKFDLSPIRRLTAIVHEEQFQIVHTHSTRSALIGAAVARQTRLPLIHHVHCQTSVEVGARRWHDRLNWLLERLVTYRAAKIIAVSPSLHRYLLSRGYSSRQLRLVANGVPERPSLPVPSSRPATIGMVALFRPRKGLEIVLRSLALLRERRCLVRFRAVGRFQSPRYERDVKRLAGELGLDELIDWTGFRADVAAELAHMQALVLPSLVSEAMPMSLLEAMAAGVPVIGARVDGITDLIADGVDGLLAPPGDAAALAETIRRVVSGEADVDRLRIAAQRKQRECYSDRSMTAGVARVYDEVLVR